MEFVMKGTKQDTIVSESDFSAFFVSALVLADDVSVILTVLRSL